MSRTPYRDISGLNSEEQHKLLDAAAEDWDWMLHVHSPGREAYYTLCLSFKDGDADEFRLLLRSLYIKAKERVLLAKLYEADFALHQADFEIKGKTARVFKLCATRAVDLGPIRKGGLS